ncbi:MAG: tRNA pseudouridine(38-40) synthase TruA, partial [Actinomycetota bacterium]|nr:tRNA pseudouridine(38-40) synthase TruA [Actinomycetota bacterium]
MSFVRVDIAYHGGEFAGWAAQPGLRTVEGELEAALVQLLGERVRLTVAGRTDAGVHAWGQVAGIKLPGEPPEALARALNALTGTDVTVLSATRAPDGFDARRDARSRTYCYRLLRSPVQIPFERGLSLFWPHRVDVELLERCAQALVGTHDFTSFTPTQTHHVRFEREVARAEWRRGTGVGPDPAAVAGGGAELLELWIEADAFMQRMVRALVGTMLEVASYRRTIEDFAGLLQGAPREAAGDTAPAHGLYLASVR